MLRELDFNETVLKTKILCYLKKTIHQKIYNNQINCPFPLKSRRDTLETWRTVPNTWLLSSLIFIPLRGLSTELQHVVPFLWAWPALAGQWGSRHQTRVLLWRGLSLEAQRPTREEMGYGSREAQPSIWFGNTSLYMQRKQVYRTQGTTSLPPQVFQEPRIMSQGQSEPGDKSLMEAGGCRPPLLPHHSFS